MIEDENLEAVPILLSIARAISSGRIPDSSDWSDHTALHVASVAARTIRDANADTLALLAHEVRKEESSALGRIRVACAELERAESYRVALAFHLLSWLLRENPVKAKD